MLCSKYGPLAQFYLCRKSVTLFLLEFRELILHPDLLLRHFLTFTKCLGSALPRWKYLSTWLSWALVPIQQMIHLFTCHTCAVFYRHPRKVKQCFHTLFLKKRRRFVHAYPLFKSYLLNGRMQIVDGGCRTMILLLHQFKERIWNILRLATLCNPRSYNYKI